jgi:pSer/pThr/pTyr-binding forkhead associated (FHA) protein
MREKPEKGTKKHPVRRAPFGAPHVLVLAVIDGDEAEGVHRVLGPETIIGRDETADLPVQDEEVSKRHCMIRVDGSVSTLLDLESTNGTFLNDRRLNAGVAHRLRHLDEIRVGQTRFFVLTGRFRARARRD